MNNVKRILTIAIPTFNRAERLDRSLSDLLLQINNSGNGQYISIFISNNGSTDFTQEIALKYRELYLKNDINFSINVFDRNEGFDSNVLQCYSYCDTDYVWFLSDDDNVRDGSINRILNDIEMYRPNVIYYNFDQYPYDLKNPLISQSVLYNSITKNNIQSILNFLFSPKLTSLVIRRNIDIADKLYCCLNLNFMHIALALQTGLDYGEIYFSKEFIANPDDDFMDHIDFVPYIGNDLISTVEQIFKLNSRTELYEFLQLRRVDPLISSVNTLALYFSDKFFLSNEVRSTLYSTILQEISIKYLFKRSFFKSLMNLFFGLVSCLRKKLTA